MALVVKDRVKVTTTTTGTGTLTLGSAVTKFQDFSVIGDGNTTYYAIESGNGTDWEVGIGTYTASGTTLSRDTILESSNAGSAINLSGTSFVFCTYPAERSVNTADIGTTIQAYDADTAKYDDTTANFTGNLQKSGANVLTANQTITLSGDATGSGTTAITVTVVDDSHNHIISNVDGLQTALDGKQPLDADLTAIGGLAKTDGNIIVGNGTTWVAESGATARTSLGLGTGDSPSFTGLTASGDVTIADKIIHSGDTNTAIRFPTADNVAIETGGVERVDFSNTAVVFNESGADVDFRIESDTNENALFLDGANGNVGIGTGSPAQKLDVNGSIRLAGSSSGNITISAPAVAGTNTLSLPASTGTIGLYADPQITIYTSGTGTYTTPTGAKYLVVEVIGGGAGGAGGGYSTDGTGGGNGGNTTFGTSLLTANGGTGDRTGSIAGGATIGAGATGLAQTGNRGASFDAYSDGNYGTGGIGGAGVYGGNGTAAANAAGTNATANSGAGGGGGGAGTAATLKYTGAGGGAGGYIKAWITSPDASYAYAIGAGGTAGTAGTNGFAGGTGGSGLIIVTAYFG